MIQAPPCSWPDGDRRSLQSSQDVHIRFTQLSGASWSIERSTNPQENSARKGGGKLIEEIILKNVKIPGAPLRRKILGIYTSHQVFPGRSSIPLENGTVNLTELF